jgi:DnaD/phage-associated family protein
MKELIKAGYIHREKERVRNEKGQLKNYIYTVYETPQEKNADEKEKPAPKNEKPASLGTEGFEPRVDFPTQGKPTQENPPLLNTNLTKYELDIKSKEETTQGGAPAEIEILKSFRECISANLTKREIKNVQELAQDYKKDLIIFAIEYASDSNKKNLNYIKALLQDWTSKGIETIDELAQMIAEWRVKNQKAKKNYEAKITRNADGTITFPQKKNNFNNYQQREYDWEKLERQLLGRMTDEEREEHERGYEEDEASKEFKRRVLESRNKPATDEN